MTGVKRILPILGTAAALGLAMFVIWRGLHEFPRLDFRAPQVWGGVIAAFGLYVVSQFLGARAWCEILAANGKILPPGRAESQLLMSQIGKYVPGNVAHLVGRYALGREDGISGARIGLALTMEVGVLLSAAVLVSVGLLLGLPVFRTLLAQNLGEFTLGPVTLLTSVMLVAALVVVQIALWRRAGCPRIGFVRLCMSALLYAANFALLGVSVWCTAHAVLPESTLDPMTATAIFAVAWTLGFIIPGAPGGIGIRDGIIALGLGLFMGEGAALAVALVHRLLSGLGDGVTFLGGLALRAVTRKPEPAP